MRNLFFMIFIILCISSFILSMFVPVYTDEIIWKVMQGRMGYDSFHNVGLLATCDPHEVPTPWLLIPFYLVDTAIYQDIEGPFPLRAIGAVLAVAWGVLCWLLLRRIVAHAISSRAVALGILAFSTLGTMPFILVMNRPEQILLVAVTALAIPLFGDPPRPNRPFWSDLLGAVILTFGCGYVLAAHPRGLVILPLMLLFAARFLARRSVAIAVGLALLVIARTALADWASRPMCADPALRSDNILDNVMFAIHEGELKYYLEHLIDSVPHPGFLYLVQFQLRDMYMADIFPGVPLSIEYPISAVTAAAFGFFLLVGVLAFLVAAVGAFRNGRRVVPVLALSALWLIYVFSIVSRVGRAIYAEEFLEPLMALASVASIWLARERLAALVGSVRLARAARIGFFLLLGLSVVNQIGLLASYVPYALSTWTDAGYAKGQKFSITPFGYKDIRGKILQTAALCGIDPNAHQQRLVVDELTYFVFRKSFAPFFGTYIDEHGWGRGIPDVKKLLTQWRSGGMVVGCQWIPTPLRSEAIENGAFCCVPPFKPPG